MLINRNPVMKDRLVPFLFMTVLAVSVSAAVAQTKQSDAAQSARGVKPLDTHAGTLVQPEHPSRARGMHGTVQVRLNVDQRGEVTAALAISGPGIFYEAAEQAARKSKFAPGARGVRLAYTFDDHIREECRDRDVQVFNRKERHADNVWDLLTTTRGTQSVSLVARLSIKFLDTGEIGEVEVVAASSTGHERTLLNLAHRIAFVPACANGQRTTVTKIVDFDEYGFHLPAR